MGYFRLPDTFPFASETVAAGNAAIGAYSRCGAWIAGNGTDGFLGVAIARMIGSPKELETLTKHHLIEKVVAGEVRFATGRVGSNKPDTKVVMPEDGYWLPAYLTYNITALEGKELSERGRKGGRASGLSRLAKPDIEPEVDRQVEQHVDERLNRQVRSGQDRTGDVNPALTEEKGNLDASESTQGGEVARAHDDPLDVLVDEVRL